MSGSIVIDFDEVAPTAVIGPAVSSVADAIVSPHRLLSMLRKTKIGRGLGPDLLPTK